MGNFNKDQQAAPYGVLLVGLGEFSETQLVPALLQSKTCQLVGVVSDDVEKRQEWAIRYALDPENCYSPEEFEQCAANREIDIVYIALPNGLHAEWTSRAAAAGKHVLCEKPMAISVAECDQMIADCRKAGVLLCIGYRLHFEPFNREVMRLTTHQVYGPVEHIIARRGIYARESGWRNNRSLSGGGSLMDLGIYCIQAAIYTMGQNPIAVEAWEGRKMRPHMFQEVEESLEFRLYFPGNITADCSCSYGMEMDELRIFTPQGEICLSPAFGYNGFAGHTPAGKLQEPVVDPIIGLLDHFSNAIRNGRAPLVSGEMGRRDLYIIEIIYKAVRSGKKELITPPGDIPAPNQASWNGSYTWLEQSHLKF